MPFIAVLTAMKMYCICHIKVVVNKYDPDQNLQARSGEGMN